MTLGQRLRQRRIKLGLTNGQVATYMGISKTHVSDLENNKSNPSLDLLRKFSKYYKTTTDWLLEQTDDPRPRGVEHDIDVMYTQKDSVAIVSELPDEFRSIVTRLAVALKDYDEGSRERALGQFILRMLGDIEQKFGKEAADELTVALDLFARTGDDSAMRTWFERYFGSDFTGGFLPDKE